MYNPIPNNPRRNRHWNTIWYNPPFNKSIRTNIVHNFLQLIDKHFQPANRLDTLFNKQMVRVSYSCTENMKSIVSKHNKTILRKHDNPSSTSNMNNDLTQPCNCCQATECTVNGKCLEKSVVYQAVATSADNQENTFKERFRNHKKSFTIVKCANEIRM